MPAIDRSIDHSQAPAPMSAAGYLPARPAPRGAFLRRVAAAVALGAVEIATIVAFVGIMFLAVAIVFSGGPS